MLGALQSWHWPVIEYVVPVQGSQPVRSTLGPEPGLQAVQLVRSLLTTFGDAHSEHAIPNDE